MVVGAKVIDGYSLPPGEQTWKQSENRSGEQSNQALYSDALNRARERTRWAPVAAGGALQGEADEGITDEIIDGRRISSISCVIHIKE